MVWLPDVNAEVAQLAVPEDTGFEPQPEMPLPSAVKKTVPPGEPEPGLLAETVAVNVTEAPKSAGVPSELTTVVLFALETVSTTAVDVTLLKFESPL
jgi:hypothetical protein